MIQNSAIGFENGKLILVADATTIKLDRSKYKTIVDGNNKHVYPGFICCNTTLGLAEIDLVRATNDYYEVGEMNANVRSIISYNTDSKIIPTVRSNGVLLAQVVPQGGTITGQSSVVELDAWNWEDASYKADEGIHLNWPRMYIAKHANAESEDVQRNRMTQQLGAIDLFFKEAKSYSMQATPVETNLRFEAMRGIFDGNKKLYVHCDFIKEIVAAVEFSKKYQVKMVLVGGGDSWRVSDLLKSNKIPVVLGNTHSLPPREDDRFRPFRGPPPERTDGGGDTPGARPRPGGGGHPTGESGRTVGETPGGTRGDRANRAVGRPARRAVRRGPPPRARSARSNPRPRPSPALSSCLLYTSPSPRDRTSSRMPSSA